MGFKDIKIFSLWRDNENLRLFSKDIQILTVFMNFSVIWHKYIKFIINILNHAMWMLLLLWICLNSVLEITKFRAKLKYSDCVTWQTPTKALGKHFGCLFYWFNSFSSASQFDRTSTWKREAKVQWDSKISIFTTESKNFLWWLSEYHEVDEGKFPLLSSQNKFCILLAKFSGF